MVTEIVLIDQVKLKLITMAIFESPGIIFDLLNIMANIFLISFLLHKGGVEGVLSHFGASAKATTDRNNRTRKTTTKWRTCEPDFHEQFTYSVPSRSIADLEKLNLHISVWDKENGRPDEYIGRE